MWIIKLGGGELPIFCNRKGANASTDDTHMTQIYDASPAETDERKFNYVQAKQLIYSKPSRCEHSVVCCSINLIIEFLSVSRRTK